MLFFFAHSLCDLHVNTKWQYYKSPDCTQTKVLLFVTWQTKGRLQREKLQQVVLALKDTS